MDLVAGQNTNVTYSEACLYFKYRLDCEAWEVASELRRIQSLVTATLILEQYSWVGTVVDEAQALSFPRYGSYYEPKLGRSVSLTLDIPSRIKNATLELAYHLLANENLMTSAETISGLEAGPVNLSNIRQAEAVPPIVRKLIKPLLFGRGSNSWWRAN